MTTIIADLQLHSRFSRAVSPQMTIPNIALWSARKGIGLVATGDWTHPMWFGEIETNLEELGNGLLRLRSGVEATMPTDLSLRAKRSNLSEKGIAASPLFLLATEVSSIYKQNGKVRRIHTLIWVPTLESARKISKEMTKRGCNLLSDGRPIIGLSSIQVADLVFSIEPKALIIPPHCWTPWFSVFGKMGGFDSIEEAFGPFAKQIYAVETGLSSNPSMNWRIKELDNRSILSFSDAHSGPKLGREATVFEIGDNKMSDNKTVRSISYEDIYDAIKGVHGNLTKPRIAYTIEFYPEEGKYHYTGHRACNIRQTPLETKAKGIGCPVCGKPLTQGVMERVEELSSRTESDLKMTNIQYPISNKNITVQMHKSKAFPKRPGFVMLVPLQEIISECIGSPVASPKVQGPYMKLTEAFRGEFSVLLTTSVSEITKIAGERIAEGIAKVRRGDLVVDPGYDGVFGVVRLWRKDEEKPLIDDTKEQLGLL